ncbi:hypothetical protein KIPB_003351 [Kipferlia bialata]|uniref:Uncharacterized protein n=1 Tax=Kipferlia bialata TaxID=797122 RepID=A0A9K3CTR5_9EUKA|nr:hypothetical protein KIPB_003351 [Kipferlia bialata]|eukprot:g3351.t1
MALSSGEEAQGLVAGDSDAEKSSTVCLFITICALVASVALVVTIGWWTYLFYSPKYVSDSILQHRQAESLLHQDISVTIPFGIVSIREDSSAVAVSLDLVYSSNDEEDFDCLSASIEQVGLTWQAVGSVCESFKGSSFFSNAKFEAIIRIPSVSVAPDSLATSQVLVDVGVGDVLVSLSTASANHLGVALTQGECVVVGGTYASADFLLGRSEVLVDEAAIGILSAADQEGQEESESRFSAEDVSFEQLSVELNNAAVVIEVLPTDEGYTGPVSIEAPKIKIHDSAKAMSASVDESSQYTGQCGAETPGHWAAVTLQQGVVNWYTLT